MRSQQKIKEFVHDLSCFANNWSCCPKRFIITYSQFFWCVLLLTAIHPAFLLPSYPNTSYPVKNFKILVDPNTTHPVTKLAPC